MTQHSQEQPSEQNPFPVVHPDIFNSSPLIQRLRSEMQWTISDDTKRPLNANLFLKDYENVVGASLSDAIYPLTTLKKLDSDPNLDAVNRTYYLQARINRFIMVDVEPEAPAEIKAFAFDFPAHYTELSTNGGVHLGIIVPDDLIPPEAEYLFDDVSVLKEPIPNDEKRPAHYEILLNDHFVTFTKRMVVGKEVADFESNEDHREQLIWLIDHMIEMDKERKRIREQKRAVQLNIGKEFSEITQEVSDAIDTFIETSLFDKPKQQAHEKVPEDYTGDDGKYDSSRYESGVASSLANNVLHLHKLVRQSYSFPDIVKEFKDPELILCCYRMLQEIIPYRDKHDEFRNGLPWLLYVARDSYEYVLSQNPELRVKQ